MEILSTYLTTDSCSRIIAPKTLKSRFNYKLLQHRVDIDPFFLFQTEIGIGVNLDAVFVQVNYRVLLLERTNYFTVISFANLTLVLFKGV